MGKQQAADAFQAFLGEDDENYETITSIYTSPLTRVRATLEQLRIQDEMKKGVKVLPPTDSILENLREIDLYDWEGITYSELEKMFPGVWRAWREGNPAEMKVFETKKGASPIERFPIVELFERADIAWDDIFRHELQKSDEGSQQRTALIVAHGSLGQALLMTAMGWDANDFREYEFPNCGMAEIYFSDCKARPETADRWRWRWPTKSASWNSNEK